MKFTGRVCFCLESLEWIARHLQKSARAKFIRMTKAGKTLRGNPIVRRTKRRFSAKQLAAQRLFAKRARAGTLRKGRRKRRR